MAVIYHFILNNVHLSKQRLNRALEETERNKSALQKAKETTKVCKYYI